MLTREKTLFEGDTEFEHYQIVDMTYMNRPARVLFSGKRDAAFSGMPLDDNHELLFDYIQRLFEMVAHTRPRRVLMIGGGVYTLPTALIRALPDLLIDCVEIDPGLDELAKSYFGYEPNERLQIIHQDGKKYLKSCTRQYDVIIIDAFTHLNIPATLADTETTQLAHKLLSRNGLLAMNIISAYWGRGADTIRHFYDDYRTCFPHVMVFPADVSDTLWIPQNLILVAQKGKKRDSYGFRFEELEPLL